MAINDKYQHNLASYPKTWIGTMISPTKICLQWSQPLVKLRVFNNETKDLIKLPNTDKAATIPTQGCEFNILAVGCQLPVIEDLQMTLLDSYRQYYTQHRVTYSETYNKDFKDFLINLKTTLTTIIQDLDG